MNVIHSITVLLLSIHFCIYFQRTSDIVKFFAEVKIYHICTLSLLYHSSYPNRKETQFSFEVLTLL